MIPLSIPEIEWNSGQIRIIKMGRIGLSCGFVQLPENSVRSSTTFGESGVNIANFSLGRLKPGGDAIALFYLDAPLPEDVLAKLRSFPAITSAKPLEFDVE